MIDTDRLFEIFRSRFSDSLDCAPSAFFAPGRINLIGEHTDYNGGFVLPGAVTQGITAVVCPNHKGLVRAYAADLDHAFSFGVDDEHSGPTAEMYLYGMVRLMREAGVAVDGMDVVYAGDVPLGAGMSSSAALESCIGTALNTIFADGSIGPMELARMGQATEHRFVGVKCGIMDQFASIYGRAGHLVRLDCRSGEHAYFAWHAEGYSLLLVNSCVRHELVGSPYNERRASCERVAAAAGVSTLRELDCSTLEQLRPCLDETDYRRALYVLGEAERVQAVCDAMERGDMVEVGRQMSQTHQGLSHDYEVSCAELDFLAQRALKLGACGARLMGGGFGGCTINLVPDHCCEHLCRELPRAYTERFGIECEIIPVEIGDGARRL